MRTESTLREEICRTAKSIFDRGLTHSSTDNISAKMEDGRPLTPTGSSRGTLDLATRYRWSTGGAEYARSSVAELGITECFSSFLPKPNLIIDDQAVADWRTCRHEYPG